MFEILEWSEEWYCKIRGCHMNVMIDTTEVNGMPREEQEQGKREKGRIKVS